MANSPRMRVLVGMKGVSRQIRSRIRALIASEFAPAGVPVAEAGDRQRRFEQQLQALLQSSAVGDPARERHVPIHPTGDAEPAHLAEDRPDVDASRRSRQLDSLVCPAAAEEVELAFGLFFRRGEATLEVGRLALGEHSCQQPFVTDGGGADAKPGGEPAFRRSNGRSGTRMARCPG